MGAPASLKPKYLYGLIGGLGLVIPEKAEAKIIRLPKTSTSLPVSG